ncbi:MAG: trimethylamine methyltransferase family protein [Candidatus Krumholzibacteriota bacterium]|nr:trimethylamine methyltransferase family protein [Candidatus Krumholzibacteriota bacterium]
MSLMPRVRWFEKEDRQKIVDEAKEILEEIGVFVENREALELLGGAGAKIDGETARISGAMVEKALETAPERILLYNRDGTVAMDLGGERIHFNPGSAALRIFDHKLGDARIPDTSDVKAFATVIDALPGYSAQSTGMIPGDVPEAIADRYRVYIGLQYSSKPIVTGTFRIDAFKSMHAMLSAVSGSEEKLREKPIAIFDCCPSPPLKWSDLTCQALIDCARTGIPAELISMPLTGATSPVTLAGAVTQHCAESLSGIVIHQLAYPGAPIIYGGSPACFDMRKGTTPMGAIETMMIDGAYAEVGKHLGVPVQAYMALSDSKPVDYQAGMETAMGAIVAAVSGINNISGPGMLDFESCQSLEKLVLDNEICQMARRLTAGIELRDDPIAKPIISQGLEKGEFLSLSHTMKWFRKEVYMPGEVIERGTLEEWRAGGRADAAGRAAAKAEKILATHKPEPLKKDTAEILRDLMEAEAKKAGMDRLPAL